MGTKRLISLLVLVAILGGVSMYYTNMLKTQSAEVMMDTSAKEMPNNEATMVGDSEAQMDTVVPALSPGNAVTPTVAAPASTAPTATAGSIEADMNALDALADAEYDDTALEASVNGTTANSLTESYDF